MWVFFITVYSIKIASCALTFCLIMTHCVQEQVVFKNSLRYIEVVTDRTHHVLSALLYLIPFSEVLHIQATLHDDSRHVPAQDERKLAT